MLSVFTFTRSELFEENKLNKVALFYDKFCFEGVLETDERRAFVSNFEKCNASDFICVWDRSKGFEEGLLGIISLSVEGKVVYIRDFFFSEDLPNCDKDFIFKYILSDYPLKDFIIKIQTLDFSYFDKYINNRLKVIPVDSIHTCALPFSSIHLYPSIPPILINSYSVKNLGSRHPSYPDKFNINEYILTIKDRSFIKRGDIVLYYNKDNGLSVGIVSNADLNTLKCSIIEIGNYGTKESVHQLSDIQKIIHSISLEYLEELTPKKGMIKPRSLIDMDRLKMELSMNFLEVFNKIV